MLGGIYTGEKCPICQQTMVDNHRDAVACPKHKNQRARQIRVMLKMKNEWVRKRFTEYSEAQRFLTGLRFKIDEGSFDCRDYQADNPLGFKTLAQQWLDLKHGQIKKHSWDNLNNCMRRASEAWGNRNIKEIGYAEIEDLLYKGHSALSDKSKANAKSALHSFFDWLRRRRILRSDQIPEFPEISFDLEYRKTISKDTQNNILDELLRISESDNPRIWIAVKWLSTYFSIRPSELIGIKEGQIDRENGFLIIPHPKEKKPKVVPLIDEDIELLRDMPLSFPEMPFFRHFKGHGGAVPGSKFGPRYLWKWWKKACDNLGVEGVDLYGGTRHSTVIHLGQFFTPEELKAASFHSTNKAFERYFRVKPEQIKSIYGYKEGGKQMENKISHPSRPKRLK